MTTQNESPKFMNDITQSFPATVGGFYNFRTGKTDWIAPGDEINWQDRIPQNEAALRVFELSQEVLGLSPAQAALRTLKLSIGREPTL